MLLPGSLVWTVHCFTVVSCLLPADMLGENAGGQGAALGFQFFSGPVVTVLASKTSRESCCTILWWGERMTIKNNSDRKELQCKRVKE